MLIKVVGLTLRQQRRAPRSVVISFVEQWIIMFVSINKLANQLPKDKPDNRAANALQEGLGGQFGEMRTMMQYLFQNFNFRGKAKPYQDLIMSVAGEEIGHVEIIIVRK